MGTTDWKPFSPAIPQGTKAAELLTRFAVELSGLPPMGVNRQRNEAVEFRRKEALRAAARCEPKGRQALVVAIHVLADLAKQGWAVRVADGQIEVLRREAGEADSRERVRNQLHAERDEQLRQPATREFVQSMEAVRVFKGRFVSIYNLFRDGEDLAVRLCRAREISDPAARNEAAAAVVQPYLHPAARTNAVP